MNGIILDTNAYVAFKKGHGAAAEILRLAEEILLPAVVLGELLAGFACGNREAENRSGLAQFLDSARVRTAPVDDVTAAWYARVYGQLRRAGRPIPTNDLWIAALSFQHGEPVFTFDDHFRAVAGLSVVTRPEDLLP